MKKPTIIKNRTRVIDGKPFLTQRVDGGSKAGGDRKVSTLNKSGHLVTGTTSDKGKNKIRTVSKTGTTPSGRFYEHYTIKDKKRGTTKREVSIDRGTSFDLKTRNIVDGKPGPAKKKKA